MSTSRSRSAAPPATAPPRPSAPAARANDERARRDDQARREATIRRLERAAGMLANAAIARMGEKFRWYRAMPAEHRAWVGLVAHAGISAFIEWFRNPDAHRAVSADVFGTAPRELIRAVTLQQTVELVRLTIDVVEERIDELAAPGDEAGFREAVLRYSREIAFATAKLYAQAAEARGAWDARLEALTVDALLRGDTDESIRSQAAALGWRARASVTVVAGEAPRSEPEAVVDAIHRAARHSRLAVLAGVLGDRLVVIVGGPSDGLAATRSLITQFGDGPVVVGPAVRDLLTARHSAQVAFAGLAAAPAWPDAPRPVLADDLLPERALAGDEIARDMLVGELYRPLVAAGAALLETLAVYLEQAKSLEAAARLLFVHPNTVRYRLRRVTEVTGYSPLQARAAFTLQLALVYGRLAATATA